MSDFNQAETNSVAQSMANCDNEQNLALPALERLLAIMARLRDPQNGCPWDIKQTFATIAPYTIEEAYEVADAIERHDMADLKDELGDLLLQVVYHSQIASEQDLFAFEDVTTAISDKLIRRHPHVFARETTDEMSQSKRWDDIKKAERAIKQAKSHADTGPQLFRDIPASFPALVHSVKLQKRAAQIGFDWPSITPILAKVEEEWAELKVEVQAVDPDDEALRARQFEEFGDLMFVLVNLGLHLGIDSEAALRAANHKFIRRMGLMETAAKLEGSGLEGLSLDELEALWQLAKTKERA